MTGSMTGSAILCTNLGNEAGKQNVALYGNKFHQRKGEKGPTAKESAETRTQKMKGEAGKKHCRNCDTDRHDEATCCQLYPELRPEWATKAPPEKERQMVTFLSSFRAARDPGFGPENCLLDTRASHHMSWDRSLFSQYTENTDVTQTVQTANESVMLRWQRDH